MSAHPVTGTGSNSATQVLPASGGIVTTKGARNRRLVRSSPSEAPCPSCITCAGFAGLLKRSMPYRKRPPFGTRPARHNQMARVHTEPATVGATSTRCGRSFDDDVASMKYASVSDMLSQLLCSRRLVWCIELGDAFEDAVRERLAIAPTGCADQIPRRLDVGAVALGNNVRRGKDYGMVSMREVHRRIEWNVAI